MRNAVHRAALLIVILVFFSARGAAGDEPRDTVAVPGDTWNYSRGITHVEQLLPAGFETSSRIAAHEYGVTGYMHQGGFCETRTGNLICGFPATKVPHDYGGDGLSPASYAWISTDRGNSWHELKTPWSDNRISAWGQGSNPFRLPSGRLLYFGHFEAVENSFEAQYGKVPSDHIRLMTSVDHGKTWGSFLSGGTDWKATAVTGLTANMENLPEKELWPPTGDRGYNRVGPLTNWDIQLLKSGRILTGIPPSWNEDQPSTTKNTIWWYSSDDEGYHWHFLGAIRRPPTGEALCEPSIVELPSGRLLCLLRTYNHRQPEKLDDGYYVGKGSQYYQLAYSDDQGKTWTDPWPIYLGSEMSQGAMMEWCLLGDFIYLIGTFDQFRPSATPAMVSGQYLRKYFSDLWDSQYYMQRTPLQLLRIPVSQFDGNPSGAFTIHPDAVRCLGVSIHQDTALRSTFSTPQIEVLSDGTLGILCDTHTRGDDRSDVLFWRIEPQWVAEGSPLRLLRGPLPLVSSDGEIRVLHSQTTIVPGKFPTGRLPTQIRFTFSARSFERRQYHMKKNEQGLYEAVQPLFTVWNTGKTALDSTPYPHNLFLGLDALTRMTRDGPCLLAVNTGAGRKNLDFPLWEKNEYDVTITIHSRVEWSLAINGEELGRFTSLCPGMPASFTLAHESFPGQDLDIGFRDIEIQPATEQLTPLEHPFLVERFTDLGRGVNEWRGDLGHLVLRRDGAGWQVDLQNEHWSRWLRYGGIVLSAADSQGSSTELLRLDIDSAPAIVIEDQGERFVVKQSTPAGRFVERNMPFGTTRSLGLAASAVHERSYLTTATDVLGWDQWRDHGLGLRTAHGIKGPLLPDGVQGPMTLIVGPRVKALRLVAWDLHPSSAMRLLKMDAHRN
jgi:hypothetical protein